MSAELYDSSEEVDVRLNLLEHVGDESVGETLTQDIISAAALLDSQAAELVGLREQLEHWRRMAGESYALLQTERQNHRDAWERFNNEAKIDGVQLALSFINETVRALSVPTPPEATEVTG